MTRQLLPVDGSTWPPAVHLQNRFLGLCSASAGDGSCKELAIRAGQNVQLEDHYYLISRVCRHQDPILEQHLLSN